MPFPEPTSPLFASFFSAWNRLEARSRHDDFAPGLAAATADPLWMLGRQWQFQELKGDDAGTPIHVRLTYETAGLDRLQLRDQDPEDLGSTPVEVLVEREQVEWDWRLRIRAGQQFERLARVLTGNPEALIARLRADSCKVEKPPAEEWVGVDYATRRFVSLMEGRAIDGKKLFDLIQADSSEIPPELRGPATEWYNRLYSQVPSRMPPAWNPEQLDYEFRMRSRDTSVPGPLHAGSYRNGSVDWDTFSLEGSGTGGFEEQPVLNTTPVHATFGGQPMRRWWEFEDRAVNFGDLDVAKTDLGKLVLIEFALVFGDDWFVVPLRAKPNSLIRVKKLQVRDCFGELTNILPARDTTGGPWERWEVFRLAAEERDGPSADFLYVPPIAGVREESPVIEEISFAKDEDANAVFAIETTVPNQLGEPVSGFAAHLETLRRRRENSGTDEAETEEAVAPTTPTKIQYVITTKVPANWIPYIATDQNVVAGLPQRRVKLRRAAIVSTEAADRRLPIAGLSRLLREGGVEWIHEEAVGREGVRVELRRQRMRSADGETYVWLGRKIGVGKGEARSGLQFDTITTPLSNG